MPPATELDLHSSEPMALENNVTLLGPNRATVLLFCERLSRRDFDGMAGLITPDATWWVVGRPDYAPYGGLRRIADVLQIIEGLVGTFDEFAFEVSGSIAEGDKVAIEATSSGRKGTARYANIYMMQYELRGGKIHSVREFFDAYEITAYLAQLGPDSGNALGNLSTAREIQK